VCLLIRYQVDLSILPNSEWLGLIKICLSGILSEVVTTRRKYSALGMTHLPNCLGILVLMTLLLMNQAILAIALVSLELLEFNGRFEFVRTMK
jgi:hypothetical protein